MTAYYDDTTGLYTAGPVTYVLLGFSAVVIVLCLLLALVKRKGDQPFTALYRCGVPGAMLCMLAGVVMTAAGFLHTVSFFSSGKYSSLLFGILTVLCGVSLIAFAAARKQGKLPDMTGFGAVVTVFWACFMLVLVLWSIQSSRSSCCMRMICWPCAVRCLGLWRGGTDFRPRPRADSAVFVARRRLSLTVSSFGRVMTFFTTGSAHFVTQVGFRLAVYAALLLYCMSNAASLLLHMHENAQKDELPQ